MSVKRKRQPLQGARFWHKLIRAHAEGMTEQGGDSAGYVMHHHFRFGKTRAAALEKYRADVALLDAYQRQLTDNSTRRVRIDKSHSAKTA